MARIILEHEGLVLRDYPLHKGGITIGRGENNAVVLGYPEVSGFHARIDRRGPEYILTDLQSTNGTSVNGRRVFSHRLSHGDRISIGKNSLLFIGTEKAKIEARETKIPLDRTVIIGGVSKHRRTTGTQIATLKDHEIPKVTSSNHPARLLMIVFALTGILVTIGVSTLKNESFSLKGIPNTERHKVNPTKMGVSKSVQKGNNFSAVTSSVGKKDEGQSPSQKDIPAVRLSSMANDTVPANDDRRFDIEAIVWSSDARKSFAIINGAEFRIGESFEGATIKEIGRDYLVLQSPRGDSIVRLSLR